jgi:hypothetical protein
MAIYILINYAYESAGIYPQALPSRWITSTVALRVLPYITHGYLIHGGLYA